MDIDLSNNGHLLRTRTLPYPQIGQFERNHAYGALEYGNLPLDHRSIFRQLSPVQSYVQSRPEDPFTWVAGPDAPWTAIKPVIDGVQVPDLDSANTSTISNGRNDGLSERRVVPSDSGYGTRQSVGNTSVFSGDLNDLDHEIFSSVRKSRSLRRPYHEESLLRGSASLPKSDNTKEATEKLQTQQRSSLICPTCRTTVKTQSELKCDICPWL